MSRHDCRLSGTVTIAAGVTRAQLYAAAQPYIEHHKLTHHPWLRGLRPSGLAPSAWRQSRPVWGQGNQHTADIRSAVEHDFNEVGPAARCIA